MSATYMYNISPAEAEAEAEEAETELVYENLLPRASVVGNGLHRAETKETV